MSQLTTVKLGDICGFQGGSQPPKSVFIDKPKKGYVRLLQIRDFKSDSKAVYIPVERAKRFCELDDIMIGRYGASVGQIHRGKEGSYNVALIKTIPDESQIHRDYLYWYLLSPEFQLSLSKVAERSAQAGFSKSDIDGFKVFLPPLPEQKRIVAILDEAFAAIDKAMGNTEKNLANARELFASQLQSVCTQCGEGWVDKPFSELCNIKHGFAFKGEFFTKTGDYVLLTPGNYFETGGYRDRGEKQKFYTGEIPSDYIMSEGDMLVAMTEQAAGLLGSPLLVPESNKFLHNQRLGLVTPKSGVPWTNEFFFHVFNTQQVRRDIHASASGLKVRHTSPKKIGDVVVSFPTSISEQNKIVSILARLRVETERLESIYQRKLFALGDLEKSILQEAFSGKL